MSQSSEFCRHNSFCVASQRVFIVVSIYFVMIQSGNFWIHPCSCSLSDCSCCLSHQHTHAGTCQYNFLSQSEVDCPSVDVTCLRTDFSTHLSAKIRLCFLFCFVCAQFIFYILYCIVYFFSMLSTNVGNFIPVSFSLCISYKSINILIIFQSLALHLGKICLSLSSLLQKSGYINPV
jgi:hypothetical protein